MFLHSLGRLRTVATVQLSSLLLLQLRQGLLSRP